MSARVNDVEQAHREATLEAWARERTPAHVWYRVRYPDYVGLFLGYGRPSIGTYGLPTLVKVLEHEAECFASPSAAAEQAVLARIVPFTVEEA